MNNSNKFKVGDEVIVIDGEEPDFRIIHSFDDEYINPGYWVSHYKNKYETRFFFENSLEHLLVYKREQLLKELLDN